MTPRQQELLDIIAAGVEAARRAALELRETTKSAEVRQSIDDLCWHLREVADDAPAAHASGLLCEVYEELKDAEACDECRGGGIE